MVLTCAGNFDWEQVCDIVKRDCEKWQKQNAPRKLENPAGSKKKVRIEKPNLVREHICIMSAAPSAQNSARFAALLLGTIIGDSVGSRFYWELVDKALAEAATMQFRRWTALGRSTAISAAAVKTSAKCSILLRIYSRVYPKAA